MSQDLSVLSRPCAWKLPQALQWLNQAGGAQRPCLGTSLTPWISQR